MELRQLGPHRHCAVTEVCLGAMTFGRETPEAESGEILARYLDAGGNFVDTANTYNRGASGGDPRTRCSRAGGTRSSWRRSAACPWGRVRTTRARRGGSSASRSRRRCAGLQTDWIDLYQIHCWDATTPLEETISTLDDLVREGKVRYVGASNYTGWQLATALGVARRARLGALRVAPTAVLARVPRHRA